MQTYNLLKIHPKSVKAMLLLLTLWALPAHAQDKQRFNAHYDNVLGTSLDVTIMADQADAEQAVSELIVEIAKLESILSTWRPDSEISQLNKHRTAVKLAPQVIDVIELCQQWFKKSSQHFSCKMGKLKQMWQHAKRTGEIPSRIDTRYRARDINDQKIVIDIAQNSVSLGQDIALDVDGIAKGYIIDTALDFLKDKLPNAQKIKVDIGGDAAYYSADQQDKWLVGVNQSSINDLNSSRKDIDHLALSNVAIASSGHNNRGFSIKHRQFSHILTPRDGWPVIDGVYATVIAPDATTADAVATALTVKTLAQGIDWVNSLDNVEAILQLPSGVWQASDKWHSLVKHNANEDLQRPIALSVTYAIKNIVAKEYNRPYVAIWLTNDKREKVRDLLLLGTSTRWARENSRWWRSRTAIDHQLLLDGLARQTRRPGEYQINWDGFDDNGTYAAHGTYTLHIEASREKGSHDYLRVKFEHNAQSTRQTITNQGSHEIGQFSLTH